MRTTLDLDPDILDAAKALARTAHTTAGRIISDTMRRAIQLGLTRADSALPVPMASELVAVCGFVPLTTGGNIVTNDLVRALRDELGD